MRKKLAGFLKTAGYSMIGVCIGFCIYDAWFNPAYRYGSAPLWLYLLERVLMCGSVTAVCFLAAWLLRRTEKR